MDYEKSLSCGHTIYSKKCGDTYLFRHICAPVALSSRMNLLILDRGSTAWYCAPPL